MNYKLFVLVMLCITQVFIIGYLLQRFANVTSHKKPMSVSLKNNTSKRPYFIFECKRGQFCGGLADRQKGIVTAYVISQILNTRFGIDVNKPCLLTNYLVPNEVDWRVSPSVLKTKNKTLWNRFGRDSQILDMTFPNITSKVKNDVIFYRGNIDRVPYLMNNPLYKQLPWTKGLSHHDLYKYVYQKLFKLSSLTQNKLDYFLKIVGTDKLFCAHLRIGKNPTMPNDVPRPNIIPDPKVVMDFLRKLVEHESSYKVFVATDSLKVKSTFNKSFGTRFIDIKGAIHHTDLDASAKTCDGVEKAILDQAVLSLCQTLIMSKSGFSRMAALIRGSDQNLYEVIKDRITQVKRQNPTFFEKL